MSTWVEYMESIISRANELSKLTPTTENEEKCYDLLEDIINDVHGAQAIVEEQMP